MDETTTIGGMRVGMATVLFERMLTYCLDDRFSPYIGPIELKLSVLGSAFICHGDCLDAL